MEALLAFAAALLALLLLFSGDAHAERACRAASEMQWFIERTGGTMMSSVGEVELRMSTGIYSGACHFFLVDSSHSESSSWPDRPRPRRSGSRMLPARARCSSARRRPRAWA